MQIGLLVFKSNSIKQFTFNKLERLKSRKLIEHLFSKGKSLSVFPFKVLYNFLELSTGTNLQAGVTVSSRNFKKAVDRNRIKRIMREGYRLQKVPLLDALHERNLQLAVFFIYTGKEIPEFAEVNQKMETVVNKLVEIISKSETEKS